MLGSRFIVSINELLTSVYEFTYWYAYSREQTMVTRLRVNPIISPKLVEDELPSRFTTVSPGSPANMDGSEQTGLLSP